MRQVLSISLPVKLVKFIKKEVKEGGFGTVSEFMRHLIRLYDEHKLWQDIEQSKKEFAEGKGIEIKKSLKELLD